MSGLKVSGGSKAEADDPGEAALAGGAAGKSALVHVASWAAGATSAPRVTHAERMAYVLDGAVDIMYIDQHEQPHGVHLDQGGFFRLPPDTIHWFRNRGSSSARLIHFLHLGSQGLGAGSAKQQMTAGWEDAPLAPLPIQLRIDETRYAIADAERLAVSGNDVDGWFRAAADVPAFSVNLHLKVGLSTKIVYGPVGSMMVARRPHGYHSTPHFHPCEQLNYVSQGSIDAFVAGPDGKSESHRLVTGDIWRVPEMAVHWTWNRSGAECELVEFHSPGLHSDPGLGEHAIPLFAADEPPVVSGNPRNIFVRPEDVPLEEIESSLAA